MDQAMDDRRRSKRLKSFLQGLVYIDKRRGAMNCVIRDLSDKGARMILSETVAIPDIVSLHIPQKDETYRARVKWRHGDEIGLAFEAADSESEHADAGESRQAGLAAGNRDRLAAAHGQAPEGREAGR
jgi:hypothetical protein